MKILNSRKNKKTSWLKKPYLAENYHAWLVSNGSLTARLQARCGDFAVQPLSVKYAKPIHDESALLRLPVHKTALIREVLLLSNRHPVVFAHSVLPRASLRGPWHQLGKLGNQALGATLFANLKVKRTPLSYKKLPRTHVLYQRASAHLTAKPAYLWARRSIFSLNCANIIVTEIFLPRLLALSH